MLRYKEIGTIYDCFYIKPEYKKELQDIYTAGLVLGIFVNELNFASRIIQLSKHFEVPIEDELLTYVYYQNGQIAFLRKERRNYTMATSECKGFSIRNDLLIKAINLINEKKPVPSLGPILAFLKNRNSDNYEEIISAINGVKGKAFIL